MLNNRILRAQELLKSMSEQKFTEKDLRGLSKIEKDFIRENGYNVELKQSGNLRSNTGIYYLFIMRNRTTGRKQLYALKKRQIVRPNEKVNGIFNYEKWLVYIARYGYFNDFEFERRFCEVPPFKFIL